MDKPGILYIGNMLNKHGLPISTMEIHSALLEEDFNVFKASGQKNRVLRLLDMMMAFLRYRRRYQVVIIATYSTLNFWYAWVISQICRVFRKKYVAYLHGGNLPERIKNTPAASRQVFKYSAANIAPSRYLQSGFESAGFKASFIPNFLSLDHYIFIERSVLRPRFLWVRAFEKTYHPEMTIRVFHEISRKYPDASLCMVGPDKDGSMANCRKLIRNLGLDNQVKLTGQLAKEAWIALAPEYDIFISTTNFDNTPVSLLEAMALGLPVVSTAVGGVPFLLGHGKTGMLSPAGNISAMVENIEQLIENKSFAREIACNARQQVTAYDWKLVRQMWLNLLHQLI